LNRLVADNKKMMQQTRAAHELCNPHNDVATASILENFHRPGRTAELVLFEARRKA
jgi:DNA-binding ferritin-like protein